MADKQESFDTRAAVYDPTLKQKKFFDAPVYFSKFAWDDMGKLLESVCRAFEPSRRRDA